MIAKFEAFINGGGSGIEVASTLKTGCVFNHLKPGVFVS
jgi:hypothetical protein